MSFGGLVAMRFAGERADSLAGLVVIDIGPVTLPGGALRIREFMSEPRELDSLEAFVERAKKFNPRRDEKLLRRSLLHNLRRTPAGTWTWKYDHRPRSDEAIVRRAADERARLWDWIEQISCPTLVVRGAESDVLSERDATELVLRLRNGELVHVSGAGHTVQGDNPKGLLEVMVPFFAKVASPGAV
jgi:pimeloyl-ACP methyl ester carboxylesterase